MSSNQNISIQEILNHLFRIRFFLTLIIILGIIVGIYLLSSNETKWKATIKLQHIDKISLQKYNYLQQVNKSVIRSFHDSGNRLIVDLTKSDVDLTKVDLTKSDTNNISRYNPMMDVEQFMDLYDEELISLLIEEASNKDLILKVLDEVKILDRFDFNSEELYYDQLENMVLNFKTLPPILTPENKAIYKRDYNPFWEISYISLDKTKAKEIIKETLFRANVKVQKFMKKSIEEYLESVKLPYEEKISILEAQKALLINQYDMSRENTITFLTEQAMLARSIGNAKNVGGTQMAAINIYPQLSYISENEFEDYYLKGYEFIEKQIELLKNRDNNFNVYIPELIEADSLIYALNILLDDNIAKLQNAFYNSPIYSNNFTSAEYNIANIGYDRVGQSNLILFIFSLLVSLAICTLVFFVSFILISYRERNL